MENKKIKICNLYCGIGGNRKLWENVEVTAVESNPEIVNLFLVREKWYQGHYNRNMEREQELLEEINKLVTGNNIFGEKLGWDDKSNNYFEKALRG